MKIDFNIIRIAQIPHTYLLPNVLALLEDRKDFLETCELEEFMCGADIFSEMLFDRETGVFDHFTPQEMSQWNALYENFQTEDIQYIHITKT